jgi:hypothetical protein
MSLKRSNVNIPLTGRLRFDPFNQLGKVSDDFLLYFSILHMFAVNAVNYDPHGTLKMVLTPLKS